MAQELHTLGWDYLMFALFIAFTVLTPLWKRLFSNNKKKRSKADYVFATGGVSMFAVMISIARGTLGVRTILGYPSELFYHGSGMWEIIYGIATAYPIVCFIFVPIYFNLGITSVYQYLDMRFKSRLVRCLASATYIVRQICSLGVTVYTPSVALSTVIGIPYWAAICGMAAICIFFSIKGGLKAAINADVIQTITVILVTMAVIVKGTITSGGVRQVYQRNYNGGRLKFFNFTGDITVRVDTTSAWLGQLFMSLSQFGCQQNFMQRYNSLKSIKDVKRAMMSNIPIMFVFFSLSWLTGLVIYSSYADCDPLSEGYIKKPDEILPFYVEDKFAFIPGFLGIFMATLFNGALCMMVSNLNSLGTVIWEDFLSLLPQFKDMTDKQQLNIIKSVTVVFGFVIAGVAYSVGLFSGVIESSLLAFSATSGPLLGCFILAMLIPIANWKGTSTGMIFSCTMVLWIVCGGLTVDRSQSNRILPTTTEGCSNMTFSHSLRKAVNTEEYSSQYSLNNLNLTGIDELVNWNSSISATTPAFAANQRTPLEYLYSISYLYYSLVGTLLTVIVGVIVSYFTQSPEDSYDAKLLHPFVFNLCERFATYKPYYTNNNMSHIIRKVSNINHAFEMQTEPNLIIIDAMNNIKHNNLNKIEKDNNNIAVTFVTASPNNINNNNIDDNSNTNTNTKDTTINTMKTTVLGNKVLPGIEANDCMQNGKYRQVTDTDLIRY